jgi:citrate synthase
MRRFRRPGPPPGRDQALLKDVQMAGYSKGLEGVVAAQTKMSFIDGEKGILEYVGIPIGELASNSTFEETVFLLWNGRLPEEERA